MARQLTQCPLCDSPLHITELSCVRCETRLHGTFPPPALARLPQEHQTFIETFVRCRGVIREVERVLGISYPTVRSRLDAAVDALEAVSEVPISAKADSKADAQSQRRQSILRQVEEGFLEPEEAAESLRALAR